jgi:pimeloyl-ACP methyl ester carboxylesterase
MPGNPTCTIRSCHAGSAGSRFRPYCWGESDRVVTPDYGRAYSRLIPGSRFALIEAAGHHPEIEQPEAFVEQVAAFLAE